MKRIKSIALLLTILLCGLSMCLVVGCKDKKVKTAKAEPAETPVKRLYVPFADEAAEEATEITGESDDYLLEEPLEPSDEEAEADSNTYPEEEPDDKPDEEPEEEPDEEPNDYPPEDPNDDPEEDPNDNWL
jgi:outer membrane biosynthesis protein TonB